MTDSPSYPASTTIGLLSDSHGRAEITRRAVEALIEAGADLLIHLGDIGADKVLDALAGHPSRVVFGNCDYPWEPLGRYAERLGIAVDHPEGAIRVGEEHIHYAHGDRTGSFHRAIEGGAGWFLHGHSHETRDEVVRGVRVVNPGALFRASRYTVCMLEAARNSVGFLQIEPD
ncbi:MAG: metallophosphoesterase family protein [Phycisphaerales bacterium]